MVPLVLAFLTGIFLVQQLAELPGFSWLPITLIGLGCLAWARLRLGFGFVVGILWAVIFAANRLNDRLPESLAGQDIEIQGYVADLPEQEENHVRFNFKVTHSKKNLPDLLRLTWYYPNHTLKAGEQWHFSVRLKPPHGTFNPGGFDYERWLFVEGVGATGYVRSKPEPAFLDNPSTLINPLVWRQQIAEQLERTLVNNQCLPMIKALTIGDGNSLTPSQWDILRKTGTTHLMVISGSHIGLVAGLVYLVTLRFWAWTGILALSPQKVAALAALAVALFYAGLTGFSVPAQRAALMVAIAMLAIIRQRNTHPYSVLALALATVLLAEPLVVLSVGFWLSFTAVALIIYVISGRLIKPGFIKGSLTVNWVTSAGLAPLLLFFFQQVSLIAPVANLIAAPIIGLLVVPLALLGTAIILVAPLVAEKLFIIVDIALQGIWWLLVRLSELPLSTLNHAQPNGWVFAFAVPGILLLFAPKAMPARGLGLILLLPLAFTNNSTIETGKFKMTLLDVGQGLSTIVQTASHVLVYDTGAKFSPTSDSGQSVLLPFLRYQGIGKIDSLVVSHGDNDHIGGVDSLMSRFNIPEVISSVPTILSRYSPIPCVSGQTWVWDGVKFSILSPDTNQFFTENDNSCVLQIQSESGTALLTGDIEATAESWLVATYDNKLKSDVLVAPHHGSQTSSSLAFLKAVNPSAILIPAGYRNQFGHPHETVLQRYKEQNINTLTSADDGAIEVNFSPKLNIKSWRVSEGRYWNFSKTMRTDSNGLAGLGLSQFFAE